MCVGTDLARARPGVDVEERRIEQGGQKVRIKKWEKRMGGGKNCLQIATGGSVTFN